MNIRVLLVVAGLGASVWAFRNWRQAVQLALVVLVVEGAIRKWFLLGAQDLVYFAKDALLLAAFAGFWTQKMQLPTLSWKPRQSGLIAFLTASVLFGTLEVFNPALPNLFVGLLGMKAYFLYIPLIFVVPHLFQNDLELARFLRRYLLLSLPVGVLAVAQFFSSPTSVLNTYARATAADSLSSAITFGSSTFVRVTATFSFITGYSAYLVTIALLTLAWLAATRWRMQGNYLMVLVLGTAFLGMLMTGSRGPVVVLAVLFPLYWWLSVARENQSGAIFFRVLAGVILLGVFLSFTGQDALGAFQGRAAGSGAEMVGRIISPFIAPYQALPNAGLLGYGIGATHQAASALTPGMVPFSWLGTNAIEVEPGRVMLELGPIGFVLIYLGRLLLALVALKTVLRLRTLFHRSIGVACFLSLLSGIPGGVVFDVTTGLLYWFCAGLLFLVERLDEEAVRASRRSAATAAPPQPVPVPARTA